MGLFVTAIAHISLYPDIWLRSVYDVEWFSQPVQLPRTQEPQNVDLEKAQDNYRVDPYRDPYFESGKRTFARDTMLTDVSAPWAVQSSRSIRRGVDHPFARRPTGDFGSKRSTALPSLPQRSVTSGGMSTMSGSRFVEKFRESGVLTRQETPSQYLERLYASRGDDRSFPKGVIDMDQPIPLPQRSEWVNADGQKSSPTSSVRSRSP